MASKDKRDLYYGLAKREGWRARSAFKLLHIDEQFKIFNGVTRALDICAAPGSWSQVLQRKLYEPSDNKEKVQIVAIDLQKMSPLTGVTQLQGDITKEDVADEIIAQFGGDKVQLIVFDGAPDVTGDHEEDEDLQSMLLVSVLGIITCVLCPGGVFVGKIFDIPDSWETAFFVSKFKMFFKKVTVTKPPSSRSSSIEAYIVCEDYDPPAGYAPQTLNAFTDLRQMALRNNSVVNWKTVPYIVCGSLEGFRTDAGSKMLIDPWAEIEREWMLKMGNWEKAKPAAELTLDADLKRMTEKFECAKLSEDDVTGNCSGGQLPSTVDISTHKTDEDCVDDLKCCPVDPNCRCWASEQESDEETDEDCGDDLHHCPGDPNGICFESEQKSNMQR